MKRIDEFDKLYPSRKARILKLKRELLAQAPQATKNFLKQDESAAETRAKEINKDRRSFLDMVGKAGVSTSILKASALVGGIFANRHALAQDFTNKRVVYCYLNSGAQNTTWLPTSATRMNSVTRPYGPDGYDVASICHFRQVNVMQEGHANASQALGVPGYGPPTMDRRIAPILGATTPYSAMYLGFRATTSGVLCSNVGPCTDNPGDAYQRFFQTAPPEAARDDTHLKVFETHHKALSAIKNKLGQEEKERLDTHGEALQKIEARLTAALSGDGPDIASCAPRAPSPGAGGGGTRGIYGGYSMQSGGKAQADIIIAALQCGLTRVATLQLGNHQGDWHGHNTAYNQDAHNSCHSSGPETNDEMVRYQSDVPAYFIKRLMDTTGPDGKKLIETTVFVQVTCMGNGRDHTRQNGPFIVATQMPGFRSGFSASSAGTTEDLNGAIPKGLGIPASMYTGMGSNNLGLI